MSLFVTPGTYSNHIATAIMVSHILVVRSSPCAQPIDSLFFLTMWQTWLICMNGRYVNVRIKCVCEKNGWTSDVHTD